MVAATERTQLFGGFPFQVLHAGVKVFKRFPSLPVIDRFFDGFIFVETNGDGSFDILANFLQFSFQAIGSKGHFNGTHAATDIHPNRCRNDRFFGCQNRSHQRTFA